MNALIINCSAGMSVYVIREGEVFSEVDETTNKHTDELLMSVDKLLSESKLKISDIDYFGVCIGPGSFTGIRVALSVIKGLNVTLNKKVVVMKNFEIYDCGNKDSILVLDGFSKFVYVRFKINNQITEVCEDVFEFCKNIKENYENIDIYSQNEKVQNTFKNLKIQSKIAKNCIISKFLEKVEHNDFSLMNLIYPVYLRASQAEIERDKKLKENSNE